jgi:hypothetical protein
VNYRRLADELADSFHNGNRTDAVNTLRTLVVKDPFRGLLVAMILANEQTGTGAEIVRVLEADQEESDALKRKYAARVMRTDAETEECEGRPCPCDKAEYCRDAHRY